MNEEDIIWIQDLCFDTKLNHIYLSQKLKPIKNR